MHHFDENKRFRCHCNGHYFAEDAYLTKELRFLNLRVHAPIT